MAGDALRPDRRERLAGGGRRLVAARAGNADVRAIQHILRPPVVVEVPDLPVAGVVAFAAFGSECPLVLVLLLVAADAFALRVPVRWRRMAVLAFNLCVTSQQRKARLVVLEAHRALPISGVMTGVALVADTRRAASSVRSSAAAARPGSPCTRGRRSRSRRRRVHAGEIDGLIGLGGVMHPDEDIAHPWLPEVRALYRQGVMRGIPVLGVCLGVQLMAQALGGSAGPLGRLRVGFLPVEFRRTTIRCSASCPTCCGRCRGTSTWRRRRRARRCWRPPTARRRRSGSASCAWGVQFHAEFAGHVGRWFEVGGEALRTRGVDVDEIVEELPAMVDTWQPLRRRHRHAVRGAGRVGLVPRASPQTAGSCRRRRASRRPTAPARTCRASTRSVCARRMWRSCWSST